MSREARLDQIKKIDEYGKSQSVKFKMYFDDLYEYQSKAIKIFFERGLDKKLNAQQILDFKREVSAGFQIDKIWNDYNLSGDPVDLVESNLSYRKNRELTISFGTKDKAIAEVIPSLNYIDFVEKNSIRTLSAMNVKKLFNNYEESGIVDTTILSLESYSTSIGDRTAYQNSQSAETIISRNIERDEWFVYDGGVPIQTSRSFCVSRYGKRFTEKEIDEWNNEVWNGKSGDVWIFTGGWNCRHVIFAV